MEFSVRFRLLLFMTGGKSNIPTALNLHFYLAKKIFILFCAYVCKNVLEILKKVGNFFIYFFLYRKNACCFGEIFVLRFLFFVYKYFENLLHLPMRWIWEIFLGRWLWNVEKMKVSGAIFRVWQKSALSKDVFQSIFNLGI